MKILPLILLLTGCASSPQPTPRVLSWRMGSERAQAYTLWKDNAPYAQATGTNYNGVTSGSWSVQSNETGLRSTNLTIP